MLKDRLRELRKSRGMTQEDFAKPLGVMGNTISQIELGQRNPSNVLVKSICREFGVSQVWLEDGVGPMYAPQDENDIEVITRAMEGMSAGKKKLIRIIAEMPDELLDPMLSYLENKYGKKG